MKNHLLSLKRPKKPFKDGLLRWVGSKKRRARVNKHLIRYLYSEPTFYSQDSKVRYKLATILFHVVFCDPILENPKKSAEAVELAIVMPISI